MAYTEYLDQVQKAYLAYYQRPADPAGQVYWAQRLEAANGNLDSLMNAFAHSEESGRLYGAINNDTIGDVIDAFYQAMFHRAPEAEGKAFYVNGFKSGKFNAGSIALDIINGAQNDDAVSIMNKMAAANFFSQAIDPDMNGEPPYMMTYNAEDEKAARDWLHTITFQSETRKTQSQVITDMKNLIANAGDPIFDVAEGFVLTNDTDVAISNIFTAGLVYTPGGNDRINSLQDEDVLTGTGDNPTLNATLGNANDNGGTTITPTLKGIETLNLAFVGSGATAVRELDLQDSPDSGKTINITRVSDGIGVATIDNIGVASENLSVSHSGQPNQVINFAFKNSALSGDDDETTLTVQDVQVAGIAVESRLPTAGIGFETINLVSKDEANSIGTLWAEDLETLNISGNADLTLGGDDTTTNPVSDVVEAMRYTAGLANTQGSLSKIDASALEGDLDITLVGDFNAPTDGTSGVNTALTVIGGKGDDIFRVAADVIGATDLVDGGEGANTMVLLGNTVINPNGAAATVKNVQNLEIRTGHDNNVIADADVINADAFDSLASIYVRNEGQVFNAIAGQWLSAAESMTVTLNNLTSAQANGITLAHGTTGNSDIANNILNVNLKVATGAADTATVTIVDGVNQDPVFNAQIAAAAVEKVTLKDNDTESNTVHLNQGAFTQAGSTIALTGGQAGKYMNLDSFGGVSVAAGVTAGYGYATNGTAGSSTTFVAALAPIPGVPTSVSTSQRDNAVGSVFYGTAGTALDGATRHLVENLDAADYAGDVVIRVGDVTRADGVSSMNLKTGAGNDTFIFDAFNIVNAGFTSGDTINAGAGTDTLVIDGNSNPLPGTPRISHQTSEWDNLHGIDVLRFGDNAPGYYVRIDNDFISQTDAGNRLTIINNDGDLNTNTESDLELDLRGLSASKWVTFVGANGVALPISANRLVLDDISANQNMILDGGDTDVRLFTTPGYIAGNNNVYEVRNSAHVSINDLAQTKNFANIEFTNDQAAVQTLTLVLNSTVVDALADASHTATNAEREALTITAFDNILAPGAFSVLDVNAAAVGSQFSLTIIGDGGNDTIISGQGADTITGGGGANNFVYTAAAQSLAGSMDTITDFATTADIIDLSAVLGGGRVAPAAITAAAAALTGIAAEFAGNEIAIFDNGVDTTVYVDVDGNNAYSLGDMVIFLQGVNGGGAVPVAGDFLV